LRTESDGRKFVSLYNEPGDQRSISYARYLFSVHLGYEVPSDIEIDHRDGDKTNDRFDNLRPMTFEMHRDKTYIFERSKEEMVYLTCPCCDVSFKRTARYIRDKKSQGQVAFHCSAKCSTTMNARSVISDELKNAIKELRASGMSSYKISDQLNLARNTVMKYWN
jgi:uncharacterized C2H2 Zn-finger protein